MSLYVLYHSVGESVPTNKFGWPDSGTLKPPWILKIIPKLLEFLNVSKKLKAHWILLIVFGTFFVVIKFCESFTRQKKYLNSRKTSLNSRKLLDLFPVWLVGTLLGCNQGMTLNLPSTCTWHADESSKQSQAWYDQQLICAVQSYTIC